MKPLLLITLTFLLAARIEVADFAAYWAKGAADPALLGLWQEAKDHNARLRITEENGTMLMHFTEDQKSDDGQKDPGETDLARTLKVGEAAFLMMKNDPASPGGSLIRYDTQEDETFILYAPAPTNGNPFFKNYRGNAIHIDPPATAEGDAQQTAHDTVSITTLNDTAMKDLEAMAATPGTFIETVRYRRLAQ